MVYSINDIPQNYIGLEDSGSEKLCCQYKVLTGLVVGVELVVPIIFIILGALGLAGCASYALLITGSVLVGMSCLSLVIYVAVSKILKYCLDYQDSLITNES
ncbi:hypothetical protein [Chlamydia sp. 04-14]|uniref:hypothetical protein n=1 Tax=Chlamydia TaxID=810 RepID=UPI002FC82178